MTNSLPILGFVAHKSNTGKTTLITKLIQLFCERQIKVSVAKHAHHHFDIDHQGKDSYAMREAGAVQTLIASSQRWALMTEMSRTLDAATEADLTELIGQFNPRYSDIIFVEGFKQALIPKIELFDAQHNQAPLAYNDAQIIAIVSDQPVDSALPQFKRDACQEIADFIQSHFLRPQK